MDTEFLLRWRSWNAQLPSLSELRIPRCYFPPDCDTSEYKLQLHLFSDASEVGYGVSSYLRTEFPGGQVHCAFMETDDFIMCLKRFFNRRGDVKELRCDNGSNFVGGQRELRKSLQEWNHAQIEEELIQRGCKWVFQPPTASNMSGVWERLVRSANTILKSILTTQIVTDVVLRTLLTEVERVLNGRPLIANSDDPNDLQPAHFLMQRKVISLLPEVFDQTDMFRRKWRQVQFLADLFWKRWLKEYLPTIQNRGKLRKVLPNVKPNALVLLVDDHTRGAVGTLVALSRPSQGRMAWCEPLKLRPRTLSILVPSRSYAYWRRTLNAYDNHELVTLNVLV